LLENSKRISNRTEQRDTGLGGEGNRCDKRTTNKLVDARGGRKKKLETQSKQLNHRLEGWLGIVGTLLAYRKLSGARRKPAKGLDRGTELIVAEISGRT